MKLFDIFKKRNEVDDGTPKKASDTWVFQLMDPETGERSPAFISTPQDIVKKFVETPDDLEGFDPEKAMRTIVLPIIKEGEIVYSTAPPTSMRSLVDLFKDIEWNEQGEEDGGNHSTTA